MKPWRLGNGCRLAVLTVPFLSHYPLPNLSLDFRMVVRPHAPPLAVEEYKNLPKTGPRYQLIEGDLYVAPAPNRFHQDISRNLQGALDR